MKRRSILLNGAAAIASAVALGALWRTTRAEQALAENFEITKTDAEWKSILDERQYAVLRQEATERAGTSPLLAEHRKGTFSCAGCDLPVYSSETKFESGTGWPSFWQALPNGVATREDSTFGMVRTEVHCSRCGGHLGHVFDDGPQPTGKRHCINGVALTFKADVA